MEYFIAENKQRKYFYRNNYRFVVKAYLVSLLIIAVLLAVLALVVITQPTRGFYASRADGVVSPLKALNEPNQSATTLIK